MNQSEHRDTRRSKTKRAVDMSSMIEVVDPETMYQQRYVSVPLPDSAKAPQTATDPFRYLEEQLPSDKRRAFEKYKQSLLGSYRTSPESSSSNTTTTTPTSPKRTKQKYVYDAADDAVIDVLLRDRQCLSEDELIHAMTPANLSQWRKLNERANDIDEEVYENKKELYEEKKKALIRELEALEHSIHPDYVEYTRNLEKTLYEALERADAQKDYRESVIISQYETDIQQVEEEFELNKRNLKLAWKAYAGRVVKEEQARMAEGSADKISSKHKRKDKPVIEILRQKLGTLGDGAKRRNLTDRGGSNSGKFATVTTAISDNEVLKDLAQIHRNISSSQ